MLGTRRAMAVGPRERAAARPPARMLRFLKAYWVTFVVIASYLSVRLQARFRSQAAIQRVLASTAPAPCTPGD